MSTSTFHLYVPASVTGSLSSAIAEGAAIVAPVGSKPVSGFLLVDYDKDPHKALDDCQVFADRVDRTAHRHLERYAHGARRNVPVSSLAAIGTYDVESGLLVLGTNSIGAGEAELRLTCWLGQVLDASQLARSEARSNRVFEILALLDSQTDPERWEGLRLARAHDVAHLNS